jgi:hypothetical protein
MVFRLLGLSLRFTAGGMAIGSQLRLPFLLLALGSFGLLLVLRRVHNQSPRNLVMLYTYAPVWASCVNQWFSTIGIWA